MKKNLFGFNIIVMIYILSLATGYALFGGSLFVNGTASTVEYYDGVKLPTDPIRLDSVNNTYYTGTELTGIPYSSEEWVDDTYTLNFQKSGDMVPNLKKEQQASYTVSFTNPTVLSYTDNNIEVEILDDTENEILSANAVVSKLVVNKGENVDITFNIKTKFASVNTNNSIKAKISYMLQGSRRYFYFIVNYIGDPNYRKDAVLTTGNNFQNLISTYKANITEITFNSNINIEDSSEIGNYVSMYDISSDGDGSVLGVIKDDSNNSGKYILHIMFNNDIVYGNSDSSVLFNGFTSLTEINSISALNTSRVINLSDMFYNCSKLTSLDLSNFDTSNVTSMGYLFARCSSLTELNLENFNTQKVTSMSNMFQGCTSLTTLNISSFDTSKVTNMNQMFGNCSALTEINVSNFNTSKATNMNSMFSGCSLITKINLKSFDTSNVTTIDSIFSGCRLLESLDLSNFNFSNLKIANCMFENCKNLKSIMLGDINTSKVTAMHKMFYNCSSLTELDLSKFDTSNVTNISYMFSGCSNIENLDVSNFNTSNVTTMRGMFASMNALKNIDLSKFDTSKVTTFDSMFENCSSLTELDLSKFDTSNVTNMGFMFNGCKSLEKVNLSSFNTSNVLRIDAMFKYCYKISTLDLSSFDITNVTNTDGIFSYCNILTTVYARTQGDLEKLSQSSSKPDNVIVQLKNA